MLQEWISVKINNVDFGLFENDIAGTEQLWQAMGEFTDESWVNGFSLHHIPQHLEPFSKEEEDVLSEWNNLEDTSIEALLKDAVKHGFIDNFDLELKK